jgi:hypothetical protein
MAQHLVQEDLSATWSIFFNRSWSRLKNSEPRMPRRFG